MIDRLNAALDGRYRIERELGEGGMATVYLASDLKHNRQVALKVLKADLAQMLGKGRFFAEIETTAQLQHPNILPLFDSGEADGLLFYAMPYVEGETLREKLQREVQLPVDQALDLIRKVASALSYAHERGVVHRDIKPANILLSSGEPLVADFGIALAVQQAGEGRMTQTGLSMGTPQYMSPEQASGDRSLDPRSDVYALGAVLYEMLSGDPPFAGSSAQAVLARVLTTLPARVTVARPTVPPHVDAAIARSLEKIPADRFTTAADFRKALDDPSFRHTTVTHIEGGDQPKVVVRRKNPVLMAALGVLAALALGLAAVGWLRPTPEEPVTVWRVDLPVGDFGGPDFSISPDGRSIAYIDSEQNLMLRAIGSLESTAVPGGSPAESPYFSHDGRSILFDRAPGAEETWATVQMSGGTVVSVTDPGLAAGGQATWAWDDSWAYVSVRTYDRRELHRVRPSGGASERIETERSVRSMAAIPGDPDRLIVGAPMHDSMGGGPGIHLLDLETGGLEFLPGLTFSTNPTVVGDYLFWVNAQYILQAARFDRRRARLASVPVAIAEGLAGAASYSVSPAGVLMYSAGREAADGGESLALVSEDRSIEIVDDRLGTDFGDFDAVRMSPDGRLLAAQFQRGPDSSPDRVDHIAIYDLEQGTSPQLTFEGTRNITPRWVDDGRVMYVSDRSGGRALWIEPADRSAPARLVWEAEPGVAIGDFDVSEVDESLIVVALEPEAGSELAQGVYRLAPGETPELVPIVGTSAAERSVDISPDGRWVVYTSDETGRDEIYVRALPDGGRPWPISTSGGVAAKWNRDGSAIYFVGPNQTMWRASVATDGGVRVTERSELFDRSNDFELNQGGLASYDVADDGRLVVVAEANAASYLPTLPVVITNVFRLVDERLVAADGVSGR